MMKLVKTDSGFYTIYREGYLTLVPNRPDTVYYSPHVDQLYDLLMTSRDVSSKPPFKTLEMGIKQALGCFGTPSIKTWTTLQKPMPVSHVRFIESTLKYIIGIPRELSFVTQYRMLKLEERQGDRLGNYNQFFIGEPMAGPNGRLDLLKNQALDKTLYRWLSHDHGASDLIYTLKILFGNRGD